MKNTILLMIAVSTLLMGCEKQQVGYLHHDSAGYRPDSLTIKASLNLQIPEDSIRIATEMPWQSGEIEGVQGTAQIHYEIADIHPDNGYSNAINQFKTVGKGIIQIEYNHTLPVGDYTIDLEIWNEGHSVTKYSIFKVKVE